MSADMSQTGYTTSTPKQDDWWKFRLVFYSPETTESGLFFEASDGGKVEKFTIKLLMNGSPSLDSIPKKNVRAWLDIYDFR